MAGPLFRAGERLREERVRLGLNQLEFGRLGGAGKNSQMAYEAGRTAPNLDYLFALSESGVDVGYVVTGRRSDSELGHEDRWLLDQFHSLSVRERSGIMQMLTTLAGASGGAVSDVGAPENDRTLHDNSRKFRGKGEA